MRHGFLHGQRSIRLLAAAIANPDVIGLASGAKFFLAAVLVVTGTSVNPTPEFLKRMKWMLIGTQFITVLASSLVLDFFPISRARSAATRRALNDRHSVPA